MDYKSMKIADLITECKKRNIKGYSGKKKDDIINLLNGVEEGTSKQSKGQFYTVNNSYILEGLEFPYKGENINVIEPFAGQGDLIKWLKERDIHNVEAYDIEPKYEGIIKKDTLLFPPIYKNKWIITNPPYLARNKCTDKTIFDKYNTNDLYKCFITSLTSQEKCEGGIFIIPVGFFLSPRDVDVRCRDEFLSKYKITRVKYFEEDVFPDTTTTVVAFSFIKSDVELIKQDIEWVLLPSGNKRIFNLSKENDWIIGGDIYNLKTPSNIKVRRWVEEEENRTVLQEGEQLTNLTLHCLDSGTVSGRIHLEYKEGYIYPSKNTSRTYATLCIQGKKLSIKDQIELSKKFNEFIEKKREETWSLFLPQFRESKEYARKRIPFELSYKIVLHLL